MIAGPVPTIYADLLCTVDGLKAFHARRVGLELVPAWPLDEGHILLQDYKEPGPVAKAGDFPFDYRSMLACAQGRPTEAFGPIYARFDGTEAVARLPNPPYHFITRALEIDGEIGALHDGMRVVVELRRGTLELEQSAEPWAGWWGASSLVADGEPIEVRIPSFRAS